MIEVILPASTRNWASRCWRARRAGGRRGRPGRCCPCRGRRRESSSGPCRRAGTSRRPARRRAASGRCRRRGSRISVRSSISATAPATSPSFRRSKNTSIVSVAPMARVYRATAVPPRPAPGPARSRRLSRPRPPPPPPSRRRTRRHRRPSRDDDGELPIVPRAAIMPPKLGIGDELIRPGRAPAAAAAVAARRGVRPYHAGM